MPTTTEEDESSAATSDQGTFTTNNTNGVTEDDDEDSSDSSAEETTATERESAEAAKARLRSKIRAQAETLLSSKTSGSGSQRHSSRSAGSHHRHNKGSSSSGGGRPSGTAAKSGGNLSAPGSQKTGEQSQEPPLRGVSRESSENSEAMDGSRRSVRFEEDTPVVPAAVKDKKAAHFSDGPDVEMGNNSEQEQAKADRRAKLTQFKSGGEGDEEEDTSNNSDGLPDITLEIEKEEGWCSGGAGAGILLCVLFMITWVVAVPIALSFRDSDDSEDPADVTLPPTLPDGTVPTVPDATDAPTDPPVPATNPPIIFGRPPTEAPAGDPTDSGSGSDPDPGPDLMSSLPDFTISALEDPDSPQSMAYEWMMETPDALASYPTGRKLQRFALATLYYATNGDEWTDNTAWLADSDDVPHECFWFNQVPACNSRQEYYFLKLDSNNLVGNLPPELSLLTSLVEIHLAGNALTEPIPAEMGGTGDGESGLVSLEVLDLQGNQFQGPLPGALGYMDNLKQLWLDEALVETTTDGGSSTIPTELGLLTSLEELRLNGNHLVGPIPPQLGSMSALLQMNLRDNALSAEIPVDLARLPVLTSLDLAENNLGAQIPSEIAWLNQSLTVLHLENNAFSGAVPDRLSRLPLLQELWIHGNDLTGIIPPALCYFKRIGKVSTISIDCNEVTCTCDCECGTELTGDEPEVESIPPVEDIPVPPVQETPAPTEATVVETTPAPTETTIVETTPAPTQVAVVETTPASTVEPAGPATADPDSDFSAFSNGAGRVRRN